jgi:uncharacterized membrane protein YidH (DUF202 family)
LSEAELAYSRNDSSLAFSLAVQSQTQLSSFLSQANTVRDAATEQKNQSFLLAIASLIVAIVILGMGILSWIYLSKKTNFQKGKFMDFAKYKMVILIFMVALALFVASPGIQHFSVIPQTDPISELSILGSQQTAANYPSNVLSGENNLVFLDIANHLGHAAYYMVQIKLFNQTQLISGAILPSFYNMTFFVADEESLRLPVAFSFYYVYLGTNESSSSQPELSQIRINGDVCNTQGSSVSWDPERNQFFGYLAFELWVYNSTTGNFQNHDRMVDLRLYLEF